MVERRPALTASARAGIRNLRSGQKKACGAVEQAKGAEARKQVSKKKAPAFVAANGVTRRRGDWQTRCGYPWAMDRFQRLFRNHYGRRARRATASGSRQDVAPLGDQAVVNGFAPQLAERPVYQGQAAAPGQFRDQRLDLDHDTEARRSPAARVFFEPSQASATPFADDLTRRVGPCRDSLAIPSLANNTILAPFTSR
jgi:hypothetical protein